MSCNSPVMFPEHLIRPVVSVVLVVLYLVHSQNSYFLFSIHYPQLPVSLSFSSHDPPSCSSCQLLHYSSLHMKFRSHQGLSPLFQEMLVLRRQRQAFSESKQRGQLSKRRFHLCDKESSRPIFLPVAF